MLTCKTKNLNAEMSRTVTVLHFCTAKMRHCRFRPRKSLNLTKVGVAKHKVGGANLKVGGAPALPTVGIGNSARGPTDRYTIFPSGT